MRFSLLLALAFRGTLAADFDAPTSTSTCTPSPDLDPVHHGSLAFQETCAALGPSAKTCARPSRWRRRPLIDCDGEYVSLQRRLDGADGQKVGGQLIRDSLKAVPADLRLVHCVLELAPASVAEALVGPGGRRATYTEGPGPFHGVLRTLLDPRVLGGPRAKEKYQFPLLWSVAAKFVELGADVEVQMNRGLRPLHVAALHRELEVAEALSAAGADPGALDAWGDAPFVHLVMGDPDQMNILGRTLVDAAVRTEDVEGGRALVAALAKHMGRSEEEGLGWLKRAKKQGDSVSAKEVRELVAAWSNTLMPYVLGPRFDANLRSKVYVERGVALLLLLLLVLLLGRATAAPATTALLPTCYHYSYTTSATTTLLLPTN